MEFRNWKNSGEKVRIKADGKVGIGTNNPTEILEVTDGNFSLQKDGSSVLNNDIGGIKFKHNAGGIKANLCEIVGVGDTNGYVSSGSAWSQSGRLEFRTLSSTNGNSSSNFVPSTRMTIDSNGNVGIGTASPGSKLEIFHKFSSATHTTLPVDSDNIGSNESVGLFLSKQWYNNTSFRFGLAMGTLSDGKSYIQSMSNTSTGRVLLLNPNSAGNVGIGTNSPQAKFHVYHPKARGSNTSSVTSDNEAIIQELKIRQNVDTWDCISMAHNSYMNSDHQRYNILMREDGILYLSSANFILIKTAGTERLRILNNGRVGIGTNSPTHPLHVNGYVYRADFGNYAATYWADNGSGRWNDDSNGTGNNAMSIKASHGILAMAGFWTKSDERIKKNIREIDDYSSLQKVRDISCVSYNYKDGTSRGTSLQVGFIAQQVMEHFPHAVSLDQGFIPDKLERITDASWNETNVISQNLVDISGVDISGVDISGIDISGVDISGVDISNIKYKLFSQSFVDVSGVNYRFYVFDSSNNEQVELDIMGNNDNSFTFEKKWNYVYCFGKEVHDLHILDKDKLFALNFSATQEIDRIQQHQLIDISQNKINIETLKIENDNLKLQNSTLTTKVNNLQNELNNLKSIVQDLIEAQMSS